MSASTISVYNTTTGLEVPISSYAFSGTNNTTLTMNTPSGFDYSTTYTVTLSQLITDNAGNGLAPTSTSAPAPYSWSFTTVAETPSSYTAYPPSICGTLLPNVLIILDNSNSFDTDMNNNGIGSPTCTNPTNASTCSKSVLARQVLTNIINTYGNQMNIGIMSYKLPAVSKYYLGNAFYFNSFDPRSYCPTPPADNNCYNYCVNEDPRTGTYTPSAAEAECNSSCQTSNALFVANYRDAITTTAGIGGAAGSAIGSVERQTYCANIYPKTQMSVDNNNVTTYYGPMPGQFYDTSIFSTAYCYSGAPGYTYSTVQYPSGMNGYYMCSGHSGTTDTNPANGTGFSGCSGLGDLEPTDDDFALGFYNFGSRTDWYYESPTFFVNSSTGTGYLNVPIAAPSTTQTSNLLSVLAGNQTPIGFMNNPTGYMACTNTGNPNPYYTTSSTNTASGSCGYIVNAGLAPMAGTFNAALSYYNGTLSQSPNPGGVIASPIQYPCQKNFVIFITDGLPTIDTSGNFGTATNLLPGVLSAINGLRCPTSPVTGNCQVSLNLSGTQKTFDIQSYVVGVGQIPTAVSDLNQLAQAGGTAVNGQAFYATSPTQFTNALFTIFENILTQVSSGTAASILNNSQGSGANLLQAMFYPSQAFGTNAQGQPSTVNWIGEIQNLWYYVDPYLQYTTIREDTNQDNILELKEDEILQFTFNTNSNQTLVNRYADPTGNDAPSSTPTSSVPPNQVNALWQAGMKLWQRNLTTDPRTIYTGYGSTNGSTPALFNSATFSTPAAWSLMQIPPGTAAYQQAKATTLINYISGSDQPPDADGQTYRSRTVYLTGCGLSDSEACNREWKLGDIVSSTPKIVSNIPLGTYQNSPPTGYSDASYTAFTNSNNYQTRGMAFVGANDGMLHAFKFGTLKELSSRYIPAEMTDSSGNPATAASNLGHEEWSFVPGNVLPYLEYYTNPSYNHIFYVDRTPVVVDASIGVPSGCSSDYSACPKDYTAGSTWRTILIGGMGFGGASRPSTGSCNLEVPGSSSTTIEDCILSPISNGGLSSYFALDVTNPESPKFLWEFSGSTASGIPLGDLGAATSGPAIVRLAYRNANGQPDNTKNGKWYAIFASGPTGPIDTISHQFYGYSDQDLKIFVVDLATGVLVKTFDAGSLLGITDAFAGSITSNTIDTDRNNPSAPGYYSDDVVYIGYTQLDTSQASVGPPASPGTWTKGGVLRLTTGDWCDPNGAGTCDPTGTAPGAVPWTLGTLVKGIGPVTTAISKLQDTVNNDLWIYFGSGRFFYKDDDPSLTLQEQLFGVKEPCYSTSNRIIASDPEIGGGTTNHTDYNCNNDSSGSYDDIVSASSLVDQSGLNGASLTPTLATNATGWTVKLNQAGSGFLAERVITDPIASSSGAVFFTTLMPNSSPCTFGGDAAIWALGYNSGNVPPSNAMQGQLLLQVSTGQIQQMSMQTAFSNPGNTRYNGRRLSTPISGMPPVSQGLSLLVFPKPSKQIIQIREK
jgi:Tfp pilus tip-associated adhesin PilY1